MAYRNMTSIFLILTLCCAVTHGSSKHVHEFENIQSEDQHLDLNMLEALTHFLEQTKIHTNISAGLQRKGFSWKNCGQSSALVDIRSLSLSPDPLSLPGPVNVAAYFTVNRALNAPLKARLTVYKKILFTYIKVRSFKFGDMCSSLAKYKYRCPDQLKKIGIKCSCPIAPNTYNLGMTQFYVSSKRIPKGDYRIVMDISMNQSQVLCIDVHFSLK
ncbi:ganglioside GM2 activator-like isoform X1 [Dreissena polymorpha]|uniref:MD-2-related lipid-recognition domain-containing protein n=1 Tax=Dreissena polymorpha TaxID=45954 RepID=A0A9D4K7T9_DREPO|nr:ganglioside GM2 activator-like isoform X1 [Dreissena polymorpha]KAH3834712.1 hypothetical protein DPMN_108047 [Dreissena polymorpha]